MWYSMAQGLLYNKANLTAPPLHVYIGVPDMLLRPSLICSLLFPPDWEFDIVQARPGSFLVHQQDWILLTYGSMDCTGQAILILYDVLELRSLLADMQARGRRGSWMLPYSSMPTCYQLNPKGTLYTHPLFEEEKPLPETETHFLVRTSPPYYPGILIEGPSDFSLGLTFSKDRRETTWLVKSAWSTKLALPPMELPVIKVGRLGGEFLLGGKFTKQSTAYYVADFQKEMYAIQTIVLEAASKNLIDQEVTAKYYDKLNKIISRALRGSTVGERSAAINLARQTAGKLLAQ